MSRALKIDGFSIAISYLNSSLRKAIAKRLWALGKLFRTANITSIKKILTV